MGGANSPEKKNSPNIEREKNVYFWENRLDERHRKYLKKKLNMILENYYPQNVEEAENI